MHIEQIWSNPEIRSFVNNYMPLPNSKLAGRIAHLVSCLAADMCLAADPGVTSLILARSHIFLEIDLQLIQEGLLSITCESMCTKYWLTA